MQTCIMYQSLVLLDTTHGFSSQRFPQ